MAMVLTVMVMGIWDTHDDEAHLTFITVIWFDDTGLRTEWVEGKMVMRDENDLECGCKVGSG